MIFAIKSTTHIKNEGEYDYCIEWEGWILRENLVFNCYDIVTDEHLCNYAIDDNNSLFVQGLEDNATVSEYKCSNLIKTKSVGNYN